MSEGIDTTHAQPEPIECPSWCRQLHLHESPESDGGFHHDSNPVTTDLAGGEHLFVGVAQHIDGDGAAAAPHVEISLVDRTLHLTPAQAAVVGAALLRAAGALDLDGSDQ